MCADRAFLFHFLVPLASPGQLALILIIDEDVLGTILLRVFQTQRMGNLLLRVF